MSHIPTLLFNLESHDQLWSNLHVGWLDVAMYEPCARRGGGEPGRELGQRDAQTTLAELPGRPYVVRKHSLDCPRPSA